jgi:twitching motility protein PilT
MPLRMIDLLNEATQQGASDVHLVTGLAPLLRVDGEIVATEHEPLDRDSAKAMIYEVLTQTQIEQFERDWALCVSQFYPDVGHFRVTVYSARNCVECAIRVCPPVIRSLDELGLPEVAGDLARKTSGLVLITGPTGVGKTTTMAAMLDLINRERRVKIVTVEDPIEYRHIHRKSIIVQQEVGSDAHSFGEALTHILRQDPNVIGVGEMRDLETIATALTAAETGHLVIATLHTPDSVGTVDRIVDVFPATQQPQIITQLAATLEGVISQQLVPRIDQSGRVLATEVLIGTPAVRNVIREGKTHLLYNVVETGAEHGMHLMDVSLKGLYEAGIITYDEAVSRAHYTANLLSDAGAAPQAAREVDAADRLARNRGRRPPTGRGHE